MTEEENKEVEGAQVVDTPTFESDGDDSVAKVDLSAAAASEKTPEETTEAEPEEAAVVDGENVTKEEVFQALEEVTSEEEILEDDTESTQVELEEAIAEAETTGKPLPENIQKLVDFMEDTGGSISDYVNLNRDYSDMDNLTTLEEYYKITKPHLDANERDFLIEESFSYDEELDDDRDVRKKKIALKEQVAEAKAYLDGQKSKYYEDIKAGSKLTSEQQKAIDFFNRYTEESEVNKKVADKQAEIFASKTNSVFNDKFKGFEYNVGDKKFRFNVKDAENVKSTQGNIHNFIGKFLDKDGSMKDAKGYHKSLYTAMNADAVANHFYEQGKADAIKDSVAKGKNVDMTPRQSHGEVNVGGTKFKVVDGDTSNDFKVRIRK